MSLCSTLKHQKVSRQSTTIPKKEQRIPAATPLDFPALLPRRAKLTTKLTTAEPLRKAPHAMLTPRT